MLQLALVLCLLCRELRLELIVDYLRDLLDLGPWNALLKLFKELSTDALPPVQIFRVLAHVVNGA